jgi:bifunctional ADP-heptose synthase (sugar kinase/adenylyltransferase)
LDTRSKIISAAEARDRFLGRPVQWLSAHFDPLLAEHVRWIKEVASPGKLLIVEITNSARPLLPQRARAELAAALAMVDFVVLADRATATETAADESITKKFVERVVDRTRAEGTG